MAERPGGRAISPATEPNNARCLYTANGLLSGIRFEEQAALAAQSIFSAADLKTVQVHNFPAEGDLQCVGTSNRRPIKGLLPRCTARG
jgi:hypothetical protein